MLARFLQQQAALMAAASTQGTYINPMVALAAGQLPHALNGMPNPVVPPTSGTEFFHPLYWEKNHEASYGSMFIYLFIHSFDCLFIYLLLYVCCDNWQSLFL